MFNRLTCVLLLCMAAVVSAQAGTLVQFRTVFGTVEVELYDAEKPVTATNFKRLVQAGAYQNTFFHRVVPGFVAQGGSYNASNKFSSNLFAPPWTERGFVPSFGPITNEFSVGPFLSNTNGTIAMAKLAGNPNSATAGWFFNLANNSTNLDSQNGGFTVFGRVIRDTNNLLGFFNGRAYGNGLLNMGWWYPNNGDATNAFSALPVTYSGTTHPAYWHLVFVDISLLDIAISTTNGFPQISWTSVAGKTNTVEYTTTMPPQWQHLFSLVPNGGRVSVIDNTGDPKRFYRVRVDY
jgi:cyclophilin family peptidyl-prolyl cis-trans isomerase